MKILVPIKRVPSPDERVRVRPDGKAIDDEGLPHVVNPFDAIALEEALRIRERGTTAVEVLAVGIGSQAFTSELHTALAMGADRALLVQTDVPLDSWCVAHVLSAVVGRERPELVLMGKQAVDDDCGQAGQMLAGLLGWPQATFASRLEFAENRTLRVARETDLGLETVALGLPAVVTADLRLNEPRYASLPALMKARKRAIEDLMPADLGVTIEPRVQVLRLEQASIDRTCQRVADVAELVHRLKFEAKVI
ncbi:MAG: electron transfer flavoprotein subunit beta/FixA family protein [Planctomycetaceae bacterium]